jgi:hypothetical protein
MLSCGGKELKANPQSKNAFHPCPFCNNKVNYKGGRHLLNKYSPQKRNQRKSKKQNGLKRKKKAPKNKNIGLKPEQP